MGGYALSAPSGNATRPLSARGACHYCGPCERGCMTHSYFNSAFTTVADALRTGNCTLISNAMVHKVLVDGPQNRASGILYIDRNTKQPHEIHARTIILCAQTQESTRILLNSTTREYPNGLGNSSGVLGRSEEHTSELQSPCNLVCRLLLEKKNAQVDAGPDRDAHIVPNIDGDISGGGLEQRSVTSSASVDNFHSDSYRTGVGARRMHAVPC